MDRTQLEPIAEMTLDAYARTASWSGGFGADFGRPPTTMAKVHTMRSMIQAFVVSDDRYELGDDYSEYGRVEVQDLEHERTYLFRSDPAIAIERSMRELTLFDSLGYIRSPTIILATKFEPVGLSLSVGGSVRQLGRSRLELSGKLTYIHTWPYDVPGGSGGFNQGSADIFNELGNIDLDAVDRDDAE